MLNEKQIEEFKKSPRYLVLCGNEPVKLGEIADTLTALFAVKRAAEDYHGFSNHYNREKLGEALTPFREGEGK